MSLPFLCLVLLSELADFRLINVSRASVCLELSVSSSFQKTNDVSLPEIAAQG